MKSLMSLLLESTHYAEAFIIVKPGFFKYTQEILERFAKDGWEVKQQTSKQLLMKEARRLYAIHKKEDWYKQLCEYMASEVTTAFILVNKDMKPGKKALDAVAEIKDEIREKFGESDMRNVMHSSDSVEHMRTEKSIYFAF